MVATRDAVIAIGGGDDRQRWVTPAAWSFDPRRNRWIRLPDLRLARHGFGAAVVGQRIYVFGGAPCAGFGTTGAAESLAIPSVIG